jgi:hypothetical protein
LQISAYFRNTEAMRPVEWFDEVGRLVQFRGSIFQDFGTSQNVVPRLIPLASSWLAVCSVASHQVILTNQSRIGDPSLPSHEPTQPRRAAFMFMWAWLFGVPAKSTYYLSRIPACISSLVLCKGHKTFFFFGTRKQQHKHPPFYVAFIQQQSHSDFRLGISPLGAAPKYWDSLSETSPNARAGQLSCWHRVTENVLL